MKVENNMEEGKDSPYSNSLFCGVPEQGDSIRGDANGGHKIDMKDVLMIRKVLAGMIEGFPSHECLGEDHTIVRGDVNNDEAIDMKDVLYLRKFLAGFVNEIEPCVCQQ